MLITKTQMLHFQRLDKTITLGAGLKKVLGTRHVRMTRIEIMDRLMEKLHFLKMHNILSDKNFKIPPKWKKTLHTNDDYVDELDLLDIIARNCS